jgi:hypothetical protein
MPSCRCGIPHNHWFPWDRPLESLYVWAHLGMGRNDWTVDCKSYKFQSIFVAPLDWGTHTHVIHLFMDLFMAGSSLEAQVLQTIHILLQSTPKDSTLFCNLTAGWYLKLSQQPDDSCLCRASVGIMIGCFEKQLSNDRLFVDSDCCCFTEASLWCTYIYIHIQLYTYIYVYICPFGPLAVVWLCPAEQGSAAPVCFAVSIPKSRNVGPKCIVSFLFQFHLGI